MEKLPSVTQLLVSGLLCISEDPNSKENKTLKLNIRMACCKCAAEVEALRSMVEELRKTVHNKPMVAFSASLRPKDTSLGDGYGSTGPFNILTPWFLKR
ncbi:hypothetical protein DPEC_G00160190 [Dallia pectoralis]|uniref:Uncharacterized protein n=1 Tax=Dallia pectoralis TaxID=75939 RepID=A0ACC2GGA3_DALPE|nr:hypothetical protein DPEC_G00160190 [Dallia pectoralis]